MSCRVARSSHEPHFPSTRLRKLLNKIKEFFFEQLHLILVFAVIIGLLSAIFVPLLISTDLFDSDDECSLDSSPATPTLLSVRQDPATLTVTAELRDESDNEQWFTLERTLFSRLNPAVVVGTDVPIPDSSKLPVSREIGRTVVIDDRGIVQDRKPIPGIEYVYTVRAHNCFFRSDSSNDIVITSLFPQE